MDPLPSLVSSVCPPPAHSIQELTALYALAGRLVHAVDPADVYEAALDAIAQALGCERASVLLFDPAGVMRFVGWRGLSQAYRHAVDGHTPWKPGERNAEPLVFPDILATAEPDWLKATITAEGIRALGFIPLVVRGGVIGKFMIYRPEPVGFAAHEIELALTIARHVAMAVSRMDAERLHAKAEEEMRLSEARLRVMSEDAPVMIWTSDSKGQCLQLNRRLREFWGVADCVPDDFDWSTTIHPEDASIVGSAVGTALATGAPFVVKARYRRADGAWRILETTATPQFDAAGVFRSMVGVNLDVTDREAADAAVRQSEQRFRDLAETMPQLVWTADRDGTVTYWNSRIAHYTEVHQRSDGSLDWASLIHPDDLAATAEAWNQAAGSEVDFQFQHRLAMRDGSYRWHISRAIPVLDSFALIHGWYGTATDCHDLREARDSLRASDERQRIAVSAAGLGVFEWDPNSDAALFENERMIEIFGLASDEVVHPFSRLLDRCIYPDDRVAAAAILNRSVGAAPALEVACRITRPFDNDTRWLEIAARVVSVTGQSKRVVGVVADVTDRRRAEEHRKILIHELNHRVKNTLSVVQGLARQSFRSERSFSTRVEAFEGRLRALSAAHDQLTREDWTGASLMDVARNAFGERELTTGRILIEGPTIELSARQALAVAMCLHELTTNSVKYGALSSFDGRVRISWYIENQRFHFRWQESGGPPVVESTERGFGTTLIERILRAEFAAAVDFAFRLDGLVFVVEAPVPEGRTVS